MMLDEAVKKRDAPVAPNPYIVFGLHEFKLIFKKYYDMIYEKSKKLWVHFTFINIWMYVCIKTDLNIYMFGI